MKNTKCSWATNTSELMENYHDFEWGVPSYDDKHLFELLTLELMQSGLSWNIILNKRDSFRKAFANFDYNIVSKYDNNKIEELMNDSSIVRNRLKINAVIENAKAIIKVRDEIGSFSDLIWSYTDNKVIYNKDEIELIEKELSKKIAKDLKKLGFKFLGPVTIFSFLEASGIVNNHEPQCFKHKNT